MDTYLGVREGDPTPRMKALMTTEAQNLVKQMNHVGLNERNSYNRDKYGNRGPTHNYRLAGDVMRPREMDMPRRRERTEVNIPKKKKEIEDVLPIGGSPGPEKERLAVDLPDNIRHHFGSKICEDLLADEKVVSKTLEYQKNDRMSREKATIPPIDKELNPEYESLGNFMRMNVFPGYNVNHKISTTKSTFTDDVHLRRIPDPDKWRMQRDDLSKYAYDFNNFVNRNLNWTLKEIVHANCTNNKCYLYKCFNTEICWEYALFFYFLARKCWQLAVQKNLNLNTYFDRFAFCLFEIKLACFTLI